MNFYEFVLQVELTDEVVKKTNKLAEFNNSYKIKCWSDFESKKDKEVETEREPTIREITFESHYDIYNYILQEYSGQKIKKLLGYNKIPIYF